MQENLYYKWKEHNQNKSKESMNKKCSQKSTQKQPNSKQVCNYYVIGN